MFFMKPVISVVAGETSVFLGRTYDDKLVFTMDLRVGFYQTCETNEVRAWFSNKQHYLSEG